MSTTLPLEPKALGGYNTSMCNHETIKRGVFTATVSANEKLCDEHFLITLLLYPEVNEGKKFPPSQAGQFVQVQCSEINQPAEGAEIEWSAKNPPRFFQPELTKKQALLRRPLSLAGRADSGEETELSIIYRVVGAGTGWLEHVKPGQAVSVIGPLGNGLPVIEGKTHAALIGGGVGIPPMLYAAEALGRANKRAVAFCGSRSRNLLPLRIKPGYEKQLTSGTPSECSVEFANRGARTVIASDDGSLGSVGLVTKPFENWLDCGEVAADQLVVYSCGPEPMMRAVGEICIARGIECYLSLERHMACGMGTCQSCIVKIRDDSEQGWGYKLCCTHGPVFPAEDIIWK